MARYPRLTVLDRIYTEGMLPIFYHHDDVVLQNIAKAVHAGGSTLVEFTNRGDQAFQQFIILEQFCSKNLPAMILGAGSIVDPETAALFINSGANYIVGPSFHPEIAAVCNKRKIPYIPGCGSVTEIVNAYASGVEFVKLFPAGEVGGPSFVKAVKGPIPWVSILATGGVSLDESLKEWFDAGVSAVGLGSTLFPSKEVDSAAWSTITERIVKAHALIKAARKR